ncbi:MAG: endonuclease III [Deltaproteobacteria bacterium]|nr:endonuclease III [Deltaproteobacteria bacterium]
MATPQRLPRGAKQRAVIVDERLAETTPHPVVELDFTSAWQLLVATILAAQSTDKMINTITPVLFARWPTPADLAAADLAEVEEVVKSSGFFRQKAKTIVAAANKIVADFGGEVPTDIDALVTVPGVGRKTANVVLGAAYRIASGVVVDTHVTRVAARLGLTKEVDPERIEADLMKVFPRDRWIDVSHRLILHGRYVCRARSPDCDACALADACPRVGVEA